ncbi:MAG: glycosyltransferase family 9 protein, partial [Phycisphaerae bacterium]|nr:glycosyltransferase family 9 protein [Phycisphaerae bacterium]
EELLGRHDLQRGAFIVCVPPTRWPTKRYPVRLWRKVLAKLIERTPIVLLGAPGERQYCRAVAEGLPAGVFNLAGQTSIGEMVALIAASAGVICSDSAAKFIAPAVGVDAVTLIGPTRPERTGPYLKGRAIVADVPCQGCLKRRCSHITCMELIAPQDVAQAAEEMLASQGA